MDPKAEKMEKVLIDFAEYVFEVDDQGYYYHPSDVVLAEIADEVNRVLDMEWENAK